MSELPRNMILVGDALTRLQSLPSASVDCVITSPPYWALRNYRSSGQVGLEPSVHGWVARLVAVCDELARVLRPTGSLWLNLGDTYSRHPKHGAPPKGLVLSPERLLLALTRRGWIVRNKVAWAKPNPMPTSVSDRLNTTWEPLYLLVRSRHYYFDLGAIRVAHRSAGHVARHRPKALPDAWRGPLAGKQDGLARLKLTGRPGHPDGKNPGDVWTIATSNFRGGHFATFPEALVERPLQATCPAAVCSRCGLAWRRRATSRPLGHIAVDAQFAAGCDCGVPPRPGIVLDPFIGSGTTAVVAERLGRDWLGIELNPAFVAITDARLAAARQQPAA